MLETNVDKRISAIEALNNSWIQRNKASGPIPESTLKNMSKFEVNFIKIFFKNNPFFQATHKIQAALYTFIVSQIMSPSEKSNLQKNFLSMDKNGDGKLSEDELIEAYSKVYGNPTEARFIVKKILKASDHNSSGKIDYTGKKNKN